jgi:hypothetical protein
MLRYAASLIQSRTGVRSFTRSLHALPKAHIIAISLSLEFRVRQGAFLRSILKVCE